MCLKRTFVKRSKSIETASRTWRWSAFAALFFHPSWQGWVQGCFDCHWRGRKGCVMDEIWGWFRWLPDWGFPNQLLRALVFRRDNPGGHVPCGAEALSKNERGFYIGTGWGPGWGPGSGMKNKLTSWSDLFTWAALLLFQTSLLTFASLPMLPGYSGIVWIRWDSELCTICIICISLPFTDPTYIVLFSSLQYADSTRFFRMVESWTGEEWSKVCAGDLLSFSKEVETPFSSGCSKSIRCVGIDKTHVVLAAALCGPYALPFHNREDSVAVHQQFWILELATASWGACIPDEGGMKWYHVWHWKLERQRREHCISTQKIAQSLARIGLDQ